MYSTLCGNAKIDCHDNLLAVRDIDSKAKRETEVLKCNPCFGCGVGDLLLQEVKTCCAFAQAFASAGQLSLPLSLSLPSRYGCDLRS